MRNTHFKHVILALLAFLISEPGFSQNLIQVRPLEFDRESLENRDIRVLTEGRLERVTPDNRSLKLRGKRTIVEKLGDNPRLISKEGITSTYALPFAITQVEPREPIMGAIPLPPPPSFLPYVKVTQAFRFESNEMAHLALIAVYIVEAGRENLSSTALPAPVEFTIAAEQADRVSPERIKISRTNQFKTAEVVAVSPGDDFQLEILSLFNPDGDSIPISRIPFDMGVSLSKSKIFGRGLETSILSISVPQRSIDGVNAFVTLSVTEGNADLEQSRLSFDDTGSAQTIVRSIGTGKAKLLVQLHPFDETGIAQIEYLEIWRWLTWVLTGALLGALLGTLRQTEKQGVFQTIVSMIIGLLVGIGATFAYSQNFLVDVYRVPTIAAELGAFTISFLFSLFPQQFFSATSMKNK